MIAQQKEKIRVLEERLAQHEEAAELLFSSDLVMLPAPGMAATSLGRLRSSRPSTTKASRLWMTLPAGVEDVDAARLDRSSEW